MNQQTRKALAIVLDAAELTLHNESEDKEYHKQVAKAIKHLSAIWASAPTKFKGGYVNAYGNDIWVEDKG